MGESAVRDRIHAKSGWLIQKQLGRGQYGTAYLVSATTENGQEDEAVAKVVGLEFLPEKEHKIAFQEVDLMRQLSHDGIVSLRDHFFTEANLELVIVMEYCDQGDLRGEVKRRAQVKPIARIAESQLMAWFVQLTLALNYIHQRHILHRDLKSSNIFMTTSADKSGQDVKIGDFGISRVLEGTVAEAATVVGTPYYMSPEVCKAEPYGYKSDIWALGCVLYEMCMLKHAFESQSLLGLVYKIVSEKYDPIPPEYSNDLRLLLERVLEKSHYARPNGKDLLADEYVRKFLPKGGNYGLPSPNDANEKPGGTAPAGSDSMPVAKTSSGKLQPKPASAPPMRTSLGTTLNPQKKAQAQKNAGMNNSMCVPEASPPNPEVQIPAVGSKWNSGPEEQMHRGWNAPQGAPTSGKLDEGEFRAKVLLGRIRRALAARRQNWLQVFASFDHVGNGQLPEAEFDRAVTSMALGLSEGEIREVGRYLLQKNNGNFVLVDHFGQAITAKPSVEVQRAEAWGRQTLVELSNEASKAAGSANNVAPGAAVRVQGLQSAVGVKLNGSEGVVKDWDATGCRWVVQLEKGELKSIRDEHLRLLRPAPNSAARRDSGSDTTAIYRLLCEGGETAVPEANFLAAAQNLLKKLDEEQKRRLLLLLPKSSDGRIDVPEVISQFLVGNVGDLTMGGPLFPTAPGSNAPQVGPGPDINPQSSPTRAPVMQPRPPQKRANSPAAPPPNNRGPAPNSMPGSVPSPRTEVASPTKGNKTFGRGEGGASPVDRVHAEVALLRLAQKLLGRPAAPGPGADLLRLFTARPEEVRVEELCEAVSVSPLGISRAEVRGVFSHLATGSNEVLPWGKLAAALETSYNSGPPSEAAALDGINLARLANALQRLESAGSRATVQEFRVTLMQAEPYLTQNQLEWLMLLTDKDGEGRLIARSLLVRLGAGPANASRGAQLMVPPRPSGASRKPIAPNTPRAQVVMAVVSRIRDRLSEAGKQLTLEHVLSIFEIGTDRGTTVNRDTLACLLGHMHLGISVVEADEVVSSLSANSASGGTHSVKLASLYDTLQRAGEPEAEVLVDELREVTRERYLGRGSQFAAAAEQRCGPRSEGGDYIPESDFRRCLQIALQDDGLQAPPPEKEEEDRTVLLAEKNKTGDVRWRHFATTFLGWHDDDYQSDPGSPGNNRKGVVTAFTTSAATTWRSGAAVPGRTVAAYSPQKEQEMDLHARKPPGLNVVTESDDRKQPQPGCCSLM